MGVGLFQRRTRNVFAGLVLAAVAALLALVPVSPASAHDVLEAVEPADGSVVAVVPATVRLTFNHTPIGLGSQVLVKDENGTNQAEGPVIIVDNRVSQAVKADAPSGRYTVVWRVVSSDSHPIEGTFTFTAGPGSGTGQPGTPPASPAPAPAPAPATKTAATTGFPWGWAAGAAVLAAGLAAAGVYVRRRVSGRDDEQQ